MPLYNYACEKAHAHEVSHPMDQSPRMYCHCGGMLYKVMSAPLIKFGGNGFYSTDKNK